MSKFRVVLGLIACAAGAAIAVALGGGSAVPAATAAGSGSSFQVYWTDQGNDEIGGANLDGSNLTPGLITGATTPQQMAVVNGVIYWVNASTGGQSNGSIGEANLDGSNANQSFISGLDGPISVAADGNYVYWTNSGADTIGRANLDGSDVDNDFISTTNSPSGIAVTGQHIYWTSLTGGSIGEANLDGSDSNPSFVTGLTYPVAVAVNSSHIYWTDGDYGDIGEANIDGSGANAQFIASGAGSPTQIAIDSNHLYWIDYRTGDIDEAGLDGSAVTTLFSSGADTPEGLAVPVTAGGGTGTTASTTTTTTSPSATSSTSSTSTPTTSTTNPTTTTTQTKPTDTLVSCDYFLDTGEDVCTATVGDASGSGVTPAGEVTFSGDRSGACQLVAAPLSPGIASCSIIVAGSEDLLNVTAAYGGDPSEGQSSGTTQLLNAGQGTGVDNPSIPTFDNSSFVTTFDNLDAGATVTTEADLTDGAGESCPSSDSSQDASVRSEAAFSDLVPAGAGRAASVVSLQVRTTLRHARRGKLRLEVTFNSAKLARFAQQTSRATLIVDLTVRPKRGRATRDSVVVPVALTMTRHGVRIRAVAPMRTAQRTAFDDVTHVCKYPRVTEAFAGSASVTGTNGTAAVGSVLALGISIPAGDDNDVRKAATVAILSGTVTAECLAVHTSVTVPVSLTNTGGSGPFTFLLSGDAVGGTATVSVTGSAPAPPRPAVDGCPSQVAFATTLNETGPAVLTWPPASPATSG